MSAEVFRAGWAWWCMDCPTAGASEYPTEDDARAAAAHHDARSHGFVRVAEQEPGSSQR